MNKHIDKKWIVVWCVIYAIILASNFIDPKVTWTSGIKILGILLCVVYVILEKRNDKMLVLALVLTLLADLILFINNTSLVGVVVFCCVQFVHMIRMARMRLRAFVTYAIFLLVVFFFALQAKIDPMYAIGTVYAITLIGNIILSIKWQKATGEVAAKFAVIGFLLFISCDLCVAISYLSLTGILPFLFYMPANYFAWVFYYPSQVFISNSAETVIQ